MIAQRFGIANMKSIGMGLGTWDRTSNRTFSISVFHSPPNQLTDTEIDKKTIFFAADEQTFFFRRKDLFFREKTFFSTGKDDFFAAGQDRNRSVFGSVFPTEPRGGQFGSVKLPNHGTETLPRPIPRNLMHIESCSTRRNQNPQAKEEQTREG